MKMKYKIQVRRYKNGTNHHSMAPQFDIIETIERVIYAEQIGNFNPIFCRYNNNPRVLVLSDAGDVSDPFRREEKYAETFFIELPPRPLTCSQCGAGIAQYQGARIYYKDGARVCSQVCAAAPDHAPYQPKTGRPCSCRRGQERDNCPACEGTGQMIDFAAIRARNSGA